MFEWLTRELFFKFIKFGVVGFTGVGVDFGTTFLGKEIVKIPKYIANAIGFSVAATSNYFLNRIWTFHSQNPNIGVEFSEFFMISMIGLAINTLILWILVTKFKKNFYLSKLFAIAIVTVWNFFANAFFTFV
ncbi:MAG TPA: GtrA family protein [Bacteroidales bacterium]|nr:GtrA family protein [Bacteroidales bacterium]